MVEGIRRALIPPLSIAICVFTIYEVNYGQLDPLTQLAVFAMMGIVLCFLMYPVHRRWKDVAALRLVDFALSALTVICCGYLMWHGKELGQRAGDFTQADFVVAVIGTLLVLEATRRSIGWALPILAGAFLIYGYVGSSLPDWFFPHRGYGVDRLAAQCFLRSQGVFGVAMRVMFTYVFLFVVFGSFLEMSGATNFIVDFARRVFGRSAGGPAKVSVLASGLMGSLSGSAVANAVTTGTFTIPMMRSAGFKPHIAGGITAAAASGGALVPPVMGAGAYMMLEIIDPPVTFLQIAKSAVIPAVLYYLSIWLIVHFYAGRVGSGKAEGDERQSAKPQAFEGLVFFGALGTLIGFLLLGYTPFRSVTYSLEVILLLSIISPRMETTLANRAIALGVFVLVTAGFIGHRWQTGQARDLFVWTTWADAAIPAMLVVLLLGLFHPVWHSRIKEAFVKSSRGGISLVSASACVGIVIGVVGLTGVGTAFPNAIVPLAEQSLLAALAAIMICSIVLGMGLPSAVCYLLMATLIGPVLNKLGVEPLAAHMFIFYFGMMSMVTPPVALAGYASASIADAPIMSTSWAAFRFSLVGFTLPYMFVYRPALLLLPPQGGTLTTFAVVHAVVAAIIGIVSLAAGLAGYLRGRLPMVSRLLLFVAAALLLAPITKIGQYQVGLSVDIAGALLFLGTAAFSGGVRSPPPARA